MHLSDRTIMILKNFIAINPSIVLRKGNIQRTMNKIGSIVAEVEIEENIPEDIGIGDLSRFLSILSIHKNHDISFNGKFFEISDENKNQKTIYQYDEIITIITPPAGKNIKFVESDVKVTITPDNMSNVLKASNILGLENVALIGDGEKITFSAIKSNASSDNVFHLKLGETDKNFRFVMQRQYLNFLPLEYELSISVNNKIRFKSDKLSYYIPVEINK